MSETNNQARKEKNWLIVFVCLLILLAIFWSVDPSVFYILTGFSAFSFFKFLQNRKLKQDAFDSERQHTFHKQSSFWDEFKSTVNNPSNRNPDNQSKLVKVVITVFVGMIFLSVIIPLIFSENSSSDFFEARQRASDLYNQQQYDSASYYYRLAIEDDPDNADLYLERGNAFLNSNKGDSALWEYDRALAIRPEFKEAYYNKGLIYYNRKKYRNSINETKKAFQIDSDYTDAMLLIGDNFYNSSQLDSAMIWYDNAYSKGYRSAALSHIMAYIHDSKGNTQKAIVLYKEAISYDTTRTEIYTRLGELVSGEEGNLYRQKSAQYNTSR